MKIIAAQQRLFKNLITIYPESEALSIASIVLEDSFGIKNISVDKELTTAEVEQLDQIIERLLSKEPVQYVMGMTYFYGYPFTVNPSVLIPRPETEELIYWILSDRKGQKNLSIIDIGTGSGCIPITIKLKQNTWNVNAIDVSETALATARKNAKNLKADIKFQQLNFLNQDEVNTLPKYDIIVSNPPYIPHEERHLMPDHVLDHEPELALFVENDDALIFYRQLAQFAQNHLNPDGALYVETNEYNAKEVKALFEEYGLENVEIQEDMQGKERMVRGG